MNKRSFYSQPRVARTYERQRFAGASGQWVNRRELKLVAGLLPPKGRVLDLGCGTGRLTKHLAAAGYGVVGVDTSREMLAVARESAGRPLVQGDAFRTPFQDGSFDAVVALRLAFHYPDLRGLLQEMGRVVAHPGGVMVFDTFNWTARRIAPLLPHQWGGRVFTHRPRQVSDTVRSLGLTVESSVPCFLFSPYLYRLLPYPLVQLLGRFEAHVPETWQARVFWRVSRRQVASSLTEMPPELDQAATPSLTAPRISSFLSKMLANGLTPTGDPDDGGRDRGGR